MTIYIFLVSISNSSAPDIAISLAKGETQNTSIDPLLIQEKILKTSKLQQLQNDLAKAKVSDFLTIFVKFCFTK